MNTKQLITRFKLLEPRSVGSAVVEFTKSVLGDNALVEGERSQRTKYEMNRTTVRVPVTTQATKSKLITIKQSLAEIYDASVWVSTKQQAGKTYLEATFSKTPDFVIEAN